MIAFRDDEYLWWQVAEYAYDTFMIRIRAQRLSRNETAELGAGPQAGPDCLGRRCRAAAYNFGRTCADWI